MPFLRIMAMICPSTNDLSQVQPIICPSTNCLNLFNATSLQIFWYMFFPPHVCWVMLYQTYISSFVANMHDMSAVMLQYRNDPKFSDPQNICCNHSKVWTMWLYHRLMSPNDATEWQTVQTQIRLLLEERSDLGLHCLPRSICPKT